MEELVRTRKMVQQILAIVTTPQIDNEDLIRGVRSETNEAALEWDSVVEEGDSSAETPPSPRTTVMYRDINGDTQALNVNELDQRTQDIVAIAKRYPDPWQLYEGEDGTIRVVVSNEVLNAWKSREG